MERARGLVVVAGGVVLAAGAAWGADCGSCAGFSDVGTYQQAVVTEGRVTVTARAEGGGPGVVQVLDGDDPPSGWGLGVVGGFSDYRVDGSEVLRVEFDGSVGERVMIVMSLGADVDGDGRSGEAWLTGLAPNGDPLETVKVDFYTRPISGLFSGRTIGGFEITPADGEEFRLGVVCSTESAPLTVVDYRTLGTFQASAVNEGGVRVYGWEEAWPGYIEGTVQVTEGKGLGVVGGVADATLEEPEELLFVFLDAPAEEVWMRVEGLDVDGDGEIEGSLYGLTTGGWGVSGVRADVSRTGTGVIAVSGVLGDMPLERVWITPRDGDRLRVQQIVYTRCAASGCAGDMDGDGDTDVFDFGLFAPDFGCGTR